MFTSFLSYYVTYLKHLIQYDGFLPVPLQRKLHYSVSVFTGDTLFPVYQVTLFYNIIKYYLRLCLCSVAVTTLSFDQSDSGSFCRNVIWM